MRALPTDQVSLEHFERLHAAVAEKASKGGGQGMGMVTVPRQYHTDAAMRGAFETFGTETKGRGKTVSSGKFLKLAQECGLLDNSRVTSQVHTHTTPACRDQG